MRAVNTKVVYTAALFMNAYWATLSHSVCSGCGPSLRHALAVVGLAVGNQLLGLLEFALKASDGTII